VGDQNFIKDKKMAKTLENTNRFTSHMLRATRALTSAQIELMNAQTETTVSNEEIDRAWDLVWSNIGSVSALANVIRAAELEQSVLESDPQTRDFPVTPLVRPESAEFHPLVDAVDESIECAELLARRTADAAEQLIYAGHGESDCAITVGMVRMYGCAAESLLKSVKAELQPARVIASN
jgi:hypothetical protein